MKTRLNVKLIKISFIALITFLLSPSISNSFNMIPNDSIISINEQLTNENKNINTVNAKAIEIVNKVINKYNATKAQQQYGKALYRQTSKNDAAISEYAEIIYDVTFDNDAIIDWDIIESRYAFKEETINNKNFTLLSKIVRIFQPKSNALIFPLTKEFTKYYKVKIIDNNGELVTINFTPLNTVKTPIVSAKVVINKNNYEVIKVEGSLKNDDVKIVTLGDKSAVKKGYKLNFEISYKKDNTFGYVLDYVNLNHEFDYYKENKLLTHLYASSSLTFFEYYNEGSKKSNNFKSSNSNKTDVFGYNKSFWDNNPIVKRTAIENEIIGNFEQLNAFRSIFINSKQQISINNSDISHDPIISNINDNISKHYANIRTQQVSLHTNKNKYSKENKIYFSAYVTSEMPETIFNEKDVLYIDFIKGKEIIDSKVIKINNGKGYGTISLDKNYSPGTYKIVAYTNFMKNFNPNNFFKKDIKILNSMGTKSNSTNDKVLLKFYPEGGNVINEINNKIAFKAIDSKGNYKDIQGKIVDSDGKFISIVKSKHEGLGFFYLKPISGKSYTIALNDGSNYPIPKALNTGYSIMVDNSNSKTMTVNIRASNYLKSNKVYVLGLMDNKKYYQSSYTFKGKDLINFEISKSKLPSGVMHLILLDESKKVLANRPVYINANDNINIAAIIDNNYSDKEFVKLKIKTTNIKNSASNISLAVTKQQNNEPNDSNDNIISHFKLSSFKQDDSMTKFINKSDRASNYKLDLKMLINDSFDFKWLEKDSNTKINNYQNEKEIVINGSVTDKNDSPLKGIKLKLLTKNNKRIWSYETKTDSNGNFTINDFQEIDSTNLEFRTYNSKDKQIFSKISLSEADKYTYLDRLTFDEKYVAAMKNDNSLINSNSTFGDEGELLEGVELKGKAKEKPKAMTSRKSIYNTKPDATIDGKNLSTNNDILRSLSIIAGVNYAGGSISIRNGGSPLWLLDDMQIDGPENVNVNDIDRIEVLKSMAKTAVFGPDGVNGVIAIYTKIGVNSKYKNDIKTSKFTKLGYSLPETFTNDTKNDDDTLFWNPQISTNENGFIDVLIKRPSTSSKFLNVTVQAINKNGEIGYLNKVIKLE